MANFFRDFMQPAKTIFERLAQQKNQSVIINGQTGTSSSVAAPYYPNLPEYPCTLVRDANHKVTEIQYGEDARGYVWRQKIVRRTDGKVEKIIQENPDGSFDITFTRDTDDRVTVVNID